MRETQYYELSVHQWTNLLQLQQNRRYMDMMMRRLQMRLSSRLTRPAAQQVPLYRLLLKHVNQLIQQAEDEARHVCKLYVCCYSHSTDGSN